MGIEETTEMLQNQDSDSANNTIYISMDAVELDDSGRDVPESLIKDVTQEEEMEQSEEVVEVFNEEPMDSEEGGEKAEPDTEAVSEDEFPTEAAAKVTCNFHFTIYGSLNSQSQFSFCS